jgi:hypothetical protein
VPGGLPAMNGETQVKEHVVRQGQLNDLSRQSKLRQMYQRARRR